MRSLMLVSTLLVPAPQALLRAVARTIALWRQRSRTRAQLATLPPHLLRDIGIDSATADAEARRWFWRA